MLKYIDDVNHAKQLILDGIHTHCCELIAEDPWFHKHGGDIYMKNLNPQQVNVGHLENDEITLGNFHHKQGSTDKKTLRRLLQVLKKATTVKELLTQCYPFTRPLWKITQTSVSDKGFYLKYALRTAAVNFVQIQKIDLENISDTESEDDSMSAEEDSSFHWLRKEDLDILSQYVWMNFPGSPPLTAEEKAGKLIFNEAANKLDKLSHGLMGALHQTEPKKYPKPANYDTVMENRDIASFLAQRSMRLM